MALTQIPARVDDPKDAVLWAILHKLQTIDESTSSRLAFGMSMVYNVQMSLDRPIFEDELKQIYDILKIAPPIDDPASVESAEPRIFEEEASAGITLRDDL